MFCSSGTRVFAVPNQYRRACGRKCPERATSVPQASLQAMQFLERNELTTFLQPALDYLVCCASIISEYFYHNHVPYTNQNLSYEAVTTKSQTSPPRSVCMLADLGLTMRAGFPGRDRARYAGSWASATLPPPTTRPE